MFRELGGDRFGVGFVAKGPSDDDDTHVHGPTWSFTASALIVSWAAIALLGAGFPTGMIAVIGSLAVGGPVTRLRISKESVEADAKES